MELVPSRERIKQHVCRFDIGKPAEQTQLKEKENMIAKQNNNKTTKTCKFAVCRTPGVKINCDNMDIQV